MEELSQSLDNLEVSKFTGTVGENQIAYGKSFNELSEVQLSMSLKVLIRWYLKEQHLKLLQETIVKLIDLERSSSQLDLDFGGSAMVISNYPDAYFTGDQTFYMRLGWHENQVANAGIWMWNSNVFEIEEKDTDFVINTNTGNTHWFRLLD